MNSLNNKSIFSMHGKTVLITGATGHLGQEMVKELALSGAHVLVNSRHQERSENVVKSLLKLGLSAEPAVFDITAHHDVNQFFNSFSGRKINVLINNASSGESGTIKLSYCDHYHESFNIIVVSAHNVFLNALPSLRQAVQEDGEASVINIGSMYGIVSPDISIYNSETEANPPFYGVSKAALLQWTRYAACEFGKENIRVNSISPGPFPSTQVQKNNPNFINKLTKKVPLGRIGQGKEIKGPVLFLASQASSFVTGANIVVDGGWTCW